MKTIWIIGAAGKSSAYLVDYLVEHRASENWKILLTDMQVSSLETRIVPNDYVELHALDIQDVDKRKKFLLRADLVVSMLPAHMHLSIAQECLAHNKHLVTASYVSPEMQQMHEEAKSKGLLFLNEVGLDPGIDHMSAMEIMDNIRKKGGEIISFKSYCGGLVAPESDNNPWNYKFTWNPRNVILAGSGGAVKYLEQNHYKYIPYHRLFSSAETLQIKEFGFFDGYANRDSLKYVSHYGLGKAKTVFRGTLRRKDFCQSWNIFVQLGMTDDSYIIESANNLTYLDFLCLFIPTSGQENPADFLQKNYLLSDKTLHKLAWLGFFEKHPIKLGKGTPAQILQYILEQKWTLEPQDKDMVVMLHQIHYQLNHEIKKIQSSLVVIGKDNIHTAMAKTVGLPVAICTKLILQGKINLKGVVIPTMSEIYEPVLKELQTRGVLFKEDQA